MQGDVARQHREVENMRRIGSHPNIISFVDSYVDTAHIAIVMEYCPGRDLFDHLELDRTWISFTEPEAKRIFVQLASALAYLHFHQEIHRDVKLENISVLNQRDAMGNLQVKLLDFGLSKYIGGGSEAITFVGTPVRVFQN